MITALALVGAWLGGMTGVVGPHGPYAALATTSSPVDPFAYSLGSEPIQAPPVRVWLEEATDLFYPGDPVRLRFRTEEDAYVAVLHLDTDGRIDLLYPRSSLDAQLVRGQRAHTLPARLDRLTLGRTPGIGYFYVVASPYPLDLRSLGTRSSGRGDGWGVASLVRGDPFWALEELTRLLVRDWRFAPYAVDVISYHIGGRHRYPEYACYDGRGDLGSHAYYPSCDRLRRLLVTYPYYYDTRRYRGDRSLYLRELDDLAPRHGFKEPTGRSVPPLRPGEGAVTRPGVRGQGAAHPPPVAPERQEPTPVTPSRQRPTLERRALPREAERTEPARPREGAPRPAPERSDPPPREAEPQRREPPPREAPRESSQPRETSPPRESVRPERRQPAEPPPSGPAGPGG